MNANNLFRKECEQEELLTEGLNDYSKLPFPKLNLLIIVVFISLILLLIYFSFHKINIDYSTLSEVNGDKILVYIDNNKMPYIDDDTEIFVEGKRIKLDREMILANQNSNLNESEEIEDNKYKIFSKLFYCMELDNPNLPNDIYETTIVFQKRSIIDYLFEIGKY